MTFIIPTAQIECCVCHVVFMVTQEFKLGKMRDRSNPSTNGFYCPAGHVQYFSGRSEAEQLKEDIRIKDGVLDAVRRENEYLRRRVRAHKGALIKCKKQMGLK